MEDILTTIVAHKREQIAAEQRIISRKQMQEQTLAYLASHKLQTAEGHYQPLHSMKQALAQSATGIIAEFKRRSPSKGWIKQDADASVITPGYELAGASALSILTDETFFGGRLDDLCTARRLTKLPVLR